MPARPPCCGVVRAPLLAPGGRGVPGALLEGPTFFSWKGTRRKSTVPGAGRLGHPRPRGQLPTPSPPTGCGAAGSAPGCPASTLPVPVLPSTPPWCGAHHLYCHILLHCTAFPRSCHCHSIQFGFFTILLNLLGANIRGRAVSGVLGASWVPTAQNLHQAWPQPRPLS